MTAQIPDKLIYRGERYAIIGIKGEGLYQPEDFGLQVDMWSSACWRGYVSTYTALDKELFLTELHIGAVKDGTEWVSIKGVKPEIQYAKGYSSKGEVQWANGRKYAGLKIETFFSGGILIAMGFIRSLYVHMGFGKPYQYEHVHELLFHEGTLTRVIDHSEKASSWREAFIKQREERDQFIKELRATGLSEGEISDRIFEEKYLEEEMLKGIEWRFSLDYGTWFL